MSDLPVLYSFRRCPFAMRARWALWAAQVVVEHREIVLRDKPEAMLQASPKGTVPVLVLPHGQVIDESLDVMRWALAQRDPESWLLPSHGTEQDMLVLIEACQRDFKPHLDRSKYPQRYAKEWASQWVADADHVRSGSPTDAGAVHAPEKADDDAAMAAYVLAQHGLAERFLLRIDGLLAQQEALFGLRPALADFAIAPFVRQYARADAVRWEAGPWPRLRAWLDDLLARPEFDARVMHKHPVWGTA